MTELVIVAVGLDRPGLVDELTAQLHKASANVADSRMVNLRGQFAIILLAETPDSSAAELQQLLPEVGRKIGLTVTITTHGGVGAKSPSRGVPYRLKTYAMDQPGIVHRITHLLHGQGINIEELQTRLEEGSYSGTPLFTMELRMTVPTSVAVKSLRGELQTLCDSLNCDFDLEPA